MFDDMQSFILALEEKGKLRKIKGAHWDLEIGTIHEIVSEKLGPALLFDEIPGYPKGFRVATNLLNFKLGQKLALGVDETMSDMEVIRHWKGKMKDFSPLPPEEVDDGPVFENVLTGEEVDLSMFPTPKWHEHDGGRYIGTGVITITRDPDEGWINCGTYRVMIHDEKTLSFYMSPGKHGRLMREKYWEKGEPCPVVICFGQDLTLYTLSTVSIPWGVSEYDVAGFLKRKPIKVVKGKLTGLPIPATAEIAVEGYAPPPSEDERLEGPFGEWTGYYASGRKMEPVVYVKNLYFRNNPIIFGQPPVKPPAYFWFPIPIHTAATLWDRLDKAGATGIKGVYVHGPGNRVIGVISLKQSYPGHSRQVASMAAAFLHGGACVGRYIVTVDEDIDPSNLDEVLWAVCTRVNPEKAIAIVPGFLSSPLDPTLSPAERERKEFTTSKVFIDACWPYHWKEEVPPIIRSSDALRNKILTKYQELFQDI
jgi:4-hydroxy-3-polyprenylbenzoate decarboxylase